MRVFIEAKFVHSADSALHAAIADKHPELPDSERPQMPDLAAITARPGLVDEGAKARDIERAQRKAVADHAKAVEKFDASRAKREVAIEKEIGGLRHNAFTARTVALAFAVGDTAPVFYSVGSHDGAGGFISDNEAYVLARFFDALEAATKTAETIEFVVHDASSTLAMIRKRALLLRVPLPFWERTFFECDVTDIRDRWDEGVTQPGLAQLLRGFDLPSRSRIGGHPVDDDGVWPLLAAGKLSRVKQYCSTEVLRLRCLHRLIVEQQEPHPIDLALLNGEPWTQFSDAAWAEFMDDPDATPENSAAPRAE